jgi:hypothetical protein
VRRTELDVDPTKYLMRLFSMLVLLVSLTSQIILIESLCPDAYFCPASGAWPHRPLQVSAGSGAINIGSKPNTKYAGCCLGRIACVRDLGTSVQKIACDRLKLALWQRGISAFFPSATIGLLHRLPRPTLRTLREADVLVSS